MSVVLELLLVVLFISGLFRIPSELRSDNGPTEPPDWWFLGRSVYSVWERGELALFLVLGIFFAPLLLMLILGIHDDSEALNALASVLGVLFVCGLLFALAVGATGRPRGLVRKGLREGTEGDGSGAAK